MGGDVLATEDAMSVMEHLQELRKRIIYSVVAIVIGAGVGFAYARDILRVMTVPLRQYTDVESLIFTSPGEAFFTSMKLAVIFGVVVASPVIIWQLGAFVWPALRPSERKYLLLLPAVLGLFVGGIAFAYKVMLPVVFKFFLSFAGEDLQPFLSLGRYISFITGFLIPIGIMFQMPLFVLFLSKVGLVTPRMLRENRRIAIFAAMVIAAVVTPTVDVVNMLIAAAPIVLLYEISIWVVRLAG